jgi:hypothetical protein
LKIFSGSIKISDDREPMPNPAQVWAYFFAKNLLKNKRAGFG